MSSPLVLSLFLALFLSSPGGQDSRKAPDKPYKPVTLCIVAGTVDAPDSEESSLDDAVESVEKELNNEKDWFRLVKDRQEAEVVVEIVKEWTWTGTEGQVVYTGPTMPRGQSPTLGRSVKNVTDKHYIEANIIALGNPLRTMTASSDNVNQPDTFAGSKKAKRRFAAKDLGRKVERLCRDNYWTLLDLELILAAWQGNTREVKNLFDAGAQVGAKDNDGVTILMWAVLSSNTKTVRAVLDAGADVNAVANDGAAASLLAADDSDILKLLKKSGTKQ